MLNGLPLELGIGAGSEKTRMMGLSDGRKSFKIGLTIETQHRSVTASHPASHVSIASTALTCRVARVKTVVLVWPGAAHVPIAV